MSGSYDPARSRPGPAGEAAVDAVFARTAAPNGHRTPGDGPPRGPSGPTVMPEPAPSDEVLLVVSMIGAAAVIVGGYAAYRRFKRRR